MSYIAARDTAKLSCSSINSHTPLINRSLEQAATFAKMITYGCNGWRVHPPSRSCEDTSVFRLASLKMSKA